ncbi:hypothetical protein [Diaphorobacter aerolatus]|uniref:Uncharacterized protein n=1 Tax=Diaphorobacter aerolatus TaxID=1288495 RepID=A0A7H0GJB8_9BURK|nr:hypothetical protein [Diaphorobacter aerolatus]QNP48384.1 hypothetical protein H9K75_20915 [Diaphorobacter aerolatus]
MLEQKKKQKFLIPTKSGLSIKQNMSDREFVSYWFHFWNDRYPIEGLTHKFSDLGNETAAQADIRENTTTFNNSLVNDKTWHYFDIVVHEHVHHILAQQHYFHVHTLQFCLVQNAIIYHFRNLMGNKGEYFIRFYDLHENDRANGNVNIRAMFIAIKRLSRHVNDINTLCSKADIYAEMITGATSSKKYNYEKLYLQSNTKHTLEIEDLFSKWSESNNDYKEIIQSKDEEIGKLKTKNTIFKILTCVFGLVSLIAAVI